MRFKKKSLTAAVILLIATGAGLLLSRCGTEKEKSNPEPVAAATYVGDVSCKGCHGEEHKDWSASHHFMAMLPANDTTVLGNFDNVTLKADGVTSRFFKRDGKFIINTQGEDGLNHDYEVKFTFGFTPLQQYLIEFPGGRMQVPRVSWDTKKKQWYHQYAGSNIPAHDWLHWTGNSQNWNTMCASCHSTNLQKGYDPITETYHTTYNVINVSCESCHGPGSRHIEFINSSEYVKGQHPATGLLALGKGASQNDIVNTCGLCHSRKTDITGAVLPGSEFLDDFLPQTPTTEFFHADGLMDGEVYNYTSFMQSLMHRRGVKCTDCHNPHSGKLLKEGNLMCGSCHVPAKYDVPEHTFHKSGTAAAECKNCHMYSQEYMGNDLRHDHSFRVPRPDLSVKYGTPNACNSCHQEKNAQWAAAAIVKWYGPTRNYHFSDDLVPGSRLDEKSFSHLQRLLNDTTVPGIIKATSAEYLGSILTPESLQSLLQCLQHPDPHVRYRALRSLEGFDPDSWSAQAAPLLKDPVRAVRIAAADLFIGIPQEQVPATASASLMQPQQELERYTLYQTDFAVGNSLAGDYYTKTRDYATAEKYYRKAIRMDSMMNYARLNLSAVLSSQGKNTEALKTLNEAVLVDPRNDRAFYNRALLLAEMNDLPGAMRDFEQAIDLKTTNTRVYYNYGILLQQAGNPAKAEKVLLQGIRLEPDHGDLNYALAVYYLRSGKQDLAQERIAVLRKYHSMNPGYAELLRRSAE
jgi:tetratricopeptide (TPR) repeat protein